MTDRELLELAAKAAGIYRDALDCEWYDPSGHVSPDWNPLTDDGDALRLAVKLELLVNIDPTASEAVDGKGVEECEVHNGDPYAATRRAIVRAAAAIGKAGK